MKKQLAVIQQAGNRRKLVGWTEHNHSRLSSYKVKQYKIVSTALFT